MWSLSCMTCCGCGLSILSPCFRLLSALSVDILVIAHLLLRSVYIIALISSLLDGEFNSEKCAFKVLFCLVYCIIIRSGGNEK